MWERIAAIATRWMASTPAFCFALWLVIAWLISGPVFKFSDTWQLVINTFSSLITFLLGFLILRSQVKQDLIARIRINEIICALPMASKRVVDLDHLTEDELRDLQVYQLEMARLAAKEAAETDHRNPIDVALDEFERQARVRQGKA